MTDSFFYNSLSELEKGYYQRFLELFTKVDAQKPDKGIRALFSRARTQAETNRTTLEQELEVVFQDAKERTLRRLALLGQCQLPKTAES